MGIIAHQEYDAIAHLYPSKALEIFEMLFNAFCKIVVQNTG